MPKVRPLGIQKITIGQRIAGKMYGRISQKDLADLIDMSQQNLSYKMRHGNFNHAELTKVFKALEFDDSEIVEAMK